MAKHVRVPDLKILKGHCHSICLLSGSACTGTVRGMAEFWHFWYLQDEVEDDRRGIEVAARAGRARNTEGVFWP